MTPAARIVPTKTFRTLVTITVLRAGTSCSAMAMRSGSRASYTWAVSSAGQTRHTLSLQHNSVSDSTLSLSPAKQRTNEEVSIEANRLLLARSQSACFYGGHAARWVNHCQSALTGL